MGDISSIKSSRNKSLLWSGIFLIVFFLCIVVLVITISVNKYSNQNEHLLTRDYFSLFLGLLFFAGAIAILVAMIKWPPKIIIDKEYISYNNRIYPWSEIQQIDINESIPYKTEPRYKREGIRILFKDGSSKKVNDIMYQNSRELKLFIQEIIHNKKNEINFTIPTIDRSQIVNEEFETFKDNQFTSFRGIFILGLLILNIIFLICPGGKPRTISSIIFGFLVIIFFFLVNSWVMNYFKVSKEYFVVSNHNYLWKCNIFKLDNIAKMSFECNYRRPHSLRIVTKDFQNRIYPASTLRTSTWIRMKKKMESIGIPVENECIDE